MRHVTETSSSFLTCGGETMILKGEGGVGSFGAFTLDPLEVCPKTNLQWIAKKTTKRPPWPVQRVHYVTNTGNKCK